LSIPRDTRASRILSARGARLGMLMRLGNRMSDETRSPRVKHSVSGRILQVQREEIEGDF
jgi:hypothetical protein